MIKILLDFSYVVKTREYMTAMLEQKYSERFAALKEDISSAKYACFTTDLWDTKNHKRSFLRLKFHDDFQKKHAKIKI
jgi:hypothetical protein